MRLFPALMAVVLAAPAFAMTLDDLTLGQTVSGPALSAAELKGKVVFVVYWGTR